MLHNGEPDRSTIIIRYKIFFLIIFYLILKNAKASLPFDSQPDDTELCTGQPDVGPCKSSVQKWYYAGSPKGPGNCIMFVWGGCGGNPSNRFNSEAECLLHCAGDTHTSNNHFTSASLTTTLSTTSKPSFISPLSTVPPVPVYDRGKELTFAETGYHKTFMFAKDNTFIQLDGEVIQRFQLRLCREISFRFRTRLPHGLLVYHNVKNLAGLKMQPYALYVIVEKGQLKAVHVFGKHLTSVTVGQGLNKDEWHNVVVRIDVHGARLIAKVDQHQEEAYLKGLNHDTNYGISSNLTSVVLVGGLSSEEKLHGVKYIIESFVGCISDVILSSGKAASDLLPIEPLIATKHENVNEGCINKCRTRQNLCFFGSKCINHYNEYSCDCFGMKYEGELCDIYAATVLTLRGSSYVSYRVYDWKDRVHSSINRISLIFKTRFDDSALFYASGETSSLKHHYIAASLYNQSVYIEMDFGEGVLSDYVGHYLNSNHWNNLTINHVNKTVTVTLDEYVKEFEIPGSSYHLYIDPEIYIGGGPKLKDKNGLKSHNNFAGSFKYVFFNDISILYELKKGNPKVHYIGVLEPEFYETDVEVIPITYPFASSHIWWPIDTKTSLNLMFDFKSSQNMAVLAYSDIFTKSGAGFWEVRMFKGEIRFELVPDSGKNVTHLTYVKYDTNGTWHTVELEYKEGDIKLTVDYKNKETQMFALEFYLGDKVIIGSGLKSANLGLIGCMKDIKVNNVFIEPRYAIRTERVVGEVAIDNCNFIDPCSRPNTCEHNGRCSVKNDRIYCDCSDTGYIGQNCHFATFRKTCEELALLGYTKPDVYLIDIDGNGRFPPAHVKCEFQTSEDATKTIVEHNLPSQIDVRYAEEGNFKFNIKYREFTAEMLQELISHSLYCSQYIKYDCYMAPLELHSATWFLSSVKNVTVDYIGDEKKGSCPCSVNKTCVDSSLSCNCDISENKWHSDEGYYKHPHSLGITEMVFLQQKDLDENARGRITLGPLECVETNTQQYVVTFTTSQSYIEVPGWRKGDIAFSFRTTGTSAILLFQPPIRPNYPSFMVALTSDYQLTFNFTLNTGTTREMVINSTRKLNGGEWHKIWIDYNFYHVRFMLNTNYQMVDLLLEEEFGPFEGSMFIGGATSDLLKKSAVKQGLIGCFRGLVVNGEILDIYSYMSVHLSEIIKDCKPSCVPNPCQNKAICKELWSTFQCICRNPWAHLGTRCEININTKALTFLTPDSYLRRNYLSANTTIEEKSRLKKMMFENLLVNLRTYDSDALILYANDHLNNFFHLYVAQGNRVVYLFNHGIEIINISVFYENINKGESIQVAIIRDENSTTLHVNERNSTINKTALLLTEYSNKPWINPETEVLKPQRPPAPPADYFQINLGGMDPHSLQPGNAGGEGTNGYVGCVRGLKIGTHVVDLPLKAQQTLDQDLTGVLPHCNMRCDLEPCKNGGICTEDISRQESSCDCEHTSYFGEFCMEEKGADFNGESVLQRKFMLEGFVEKIKVQLAFSSSDLRQKNTVLLLLQTENQRSFYLIIAITPDGHLKFEEDREGAVYGAEIKNRNFLNGARHSIYYTRNGTEASLLIDRKEEKLEIFTTQTFIPTQDSGSNEVQIGGVNTTDPRFAIYKGYSGCLSNIYLSVNSYDMKPLEEYMLFTKNGAEKVIVTNSQGVRSAQCSSRFDLAADLQFQNIDWNIHNSSLGTDKTWVEDPPSRIPYIPLHYDTSEKEESTNVVFIIMCTIFVIIIIACSYEVWRSNRQHKARLERETDENIIWSKEQATKMHESPGLGLRSHTYKQIPTDETLSATPKKAVTIAVQNGVKAPPTKPNGVSINEVPITIVTTPIVVINKPENENEEEDSHKPKPTQPKRITFRDSVADQELAWEPLSEASELLAPDQEITDMDSAESDTENDYDNTSQMPRLASEESVTLPPATDEDFHFEKEVVAEKDPYQDSEDKIGPKANNVNQRKFFVRPQTIFYDNSRIFKNPLYYLGGPLLEGKSGPSLESVLSLE